MLFYIIVIRFTFYIVLTMKGCTIIVPKNEIRFTFCIVLTMKGCTIIVPKNEYAKMSVGTFGTFAYNCLDEVIKFGVLFA